MNKRRVIEHAKGYLEQLARGVDPISGQEIGPVSVAAQPQLQKCFAFVSELLGELLEHDGRVALPGEGGARFELVRMKAAFRLDEARRRRVYISPEPVTPGTFVRNVNRIVPVAEMEKLSLKNVNAWLLKNGFVVAEKVPTTMNRTVLRPTAKAEEIGVEEAEEVDPATGEVKRKLVLTDAAQLYLLNRLAGEEA